MKRELIILVAAVLMGIAAVVFYQIHIADVEQEIKSQIEDKVEICRVNEAVSVRGLLEKKNIKKESVPRVYAHPKAVKWTDRKRIRGQRVMQPLQQGQPILWSDLEESSKRTVDGSILPGRAVVTIPIDMIGGVSGLISPGSRIDLFGIFRKLPKENNQESIMKSLQAKKPTDLAELNRQVAQSARNMLTNGFKDKDAFFIVPIAANLGVFAVGSRTQASPASADNAEGRKGYSTISFDVPSKMQVLLIMAMRKIQLEGGQFVCALRSNQAGPDDGIEAGKAYQSNEFLKLISKANAEMDETK